MGLIASRLSLTQRCSIERDGATATGWGDPAVPDWSADSTDVPCRAWASSGHEPADVETVTVIEQVRLICPLDTDVTERDRVGDITERGTTIFPGPLSVRAVLHRRTHIELVLARVA